MRTIKIFSLTLCFLLIGCVINDVTRKNITIEEVKKQNKLQITDLKNQSPFLKVHMKNGNIYVFDSWNIFDSNSIINGNAVLYNSFRELIDSNYFSIGLDSIALLETNVLKNSSSAIALTIFTGITTAMAIICVASPKTCFGSCPTFYVFNGDSLHLQAEGFSSSISPSFEATDIDALYHAKSFKGELTIEMRNEALETHVIRKINLIAIPKKNDIRIFYGTDNQFYSTEKIISPNYAYSPEGDCLTKITANDGNERFSLADSNYLGEKEFIEFEFSVHQNKNYGLVLGSRQTLMTTFLLYQALAYMGNSAGYWLAEIERKRIGKGQGSIEKLIGGIEVLMQNEDGSWNSVGIIDEHGPIATDVHIVPFVKSNFYNSKQKLKLKMTKGAWRIDYVALAELSNSIEPMRILPCGVFKDGKEDELARELLIDSTKFLVTLPGDNYTLKYQLPDKNLNYEFFLESKGYYLEWIRKEWIEEENPFLLAEMFYNPNKSLRRLAPEFKRNEKKIEENFWKSRYAKP